MENVYTLRDACKILRVKPHILIYMLRNGKVRDVELVSGRRLFTTADLARISEVLKLTVWAQKERYGEGGDHVDQR